MNTKKEAEPASPVNALPVGTTLQEYILSTVVGEGGFGIVYLGHDTMLDCEVAIKEYLPSSLASRGPNMQVSVRPDAEKLFNRGMQRFEKEAHILARFRHPALVSVLRLVKANGTAYMVMPYYRGKTLREMVRGGFRAKTTEDLFSLLLPVLDGLAQIHSVSCYHLDISSDNILILNTGAPVLLDFGAARHTEVSGENPTTIILKPGFAPIEQYTNDDSELELGPWTDLYALSAVAYLLVTGFMPPASVARILKDGIKPLLSFATPELPQEVLKVIEVGLTVRPQGRTQDVEAYRTAFLNAADASFSSAGVSVVPEAIPTVPEPAKTRQSSPSAEGSILIEPKEPTKNTASRTIEQPVVYEVGLSEKPVVTEEIETRGSVEPAFGAAQVRVNSSTAPVAPFRSIRMGALLRWGGLLLVLSLFSVVVFVFGGN